VQLSRADGFFPPKKSKREETSRSIYLSSNKEEMEDRDETPTDGGNQRRQRHMRRMRHEGRDREGNYDINPDTTDHRRGRKPD
jgi:hypothetical protein